MSTTPQRYNATTPWLRTQNHGRCSDVALLDERPGGLVPQPEPGILTQVGRGRWQEDFDRITHSAACVAVPGGGRFSPLNGRTERPGSSVCCAPLGAARRVNLADPSGPAGASRFCVREVVCPWYTTPYGWKKTARAVAAADRYGAASQIVDRAGATAGVGIARVSTGGRCHTGGSGGGSAAASGHTGRAGWRSTEGVGEYRAREVHA